MRIEIIDECFETRLLRKIKPDMDKSEKSLEMAKVHLSKAGQAMKANLFDFSILASYNSMFHAARTILYRDGIQEKSHLCIIIYFKEKYGDLIPSHLINAFDTHRIERHEIMYGLEFIPTREDAEATLDDAKEFILAIENLLKK